MKNFYIAMVQQNPIVGDIAGNLAIAKQNIFEAEKENADIILFSELFLCGYPTDDLVLKPSFLNKCNIAINDIIKFSVKLNIAIIIGAPDLIEKKIYNAVYFIAQGHIIAKSYKKDLPNYAEFDEKRVFYAGDNSQIVEYKGIKIALPICEDIWNMPRLTKGDCEIILVANASPYRTNKVEKRVELISNLAKNLECCVVYVNQVGGQDELVFDGASFACNAQGEVICKLPQFQTKLAYLNISNNCAEQYIWYKDLEADYNACILAVRDYVYKNGFRNCILGLSGGLDSALCAAIVCDAIGETNLSCFMLSYNYTSQHSIDDAKKCANLLGCAYTELNISKAVEGFLSILSPAFDTSDINLWFENLQSRTRGTILMALSNKFNALLITTGNKSELATGYATIYGDMNGGFNPLKDIYKTRVYALANWRNNNFNANFLGRKGTIIPQSIIEKPASAELREGQKDEDSLAPYNILDAILYELIENDASVEQIVKHGYDKDLVKKIEDLVYLAEYKRFQAAPGVRLSKKNFGTDRRYPITNKYRDN